MPEKWKWGVLLMGQPVSFWAAVLGAAGVKAASSGESFLSALVSIPCAVVLSVLFTDPILHFWSLPDSPYEPAVAAVVAIAGQSAVRLIISITSVSALAEIIRAWRGK